MKTWSLEEAIIRAQSAVAVAVQGVWAKLVAVERVTRPPRLGHDVDVETAGADWLADMEAEIDSWEPDELRNLYEPALSADELVGVRGLLQERYETSTGHQCSGSVEHPAGVDTSFPPEAVPPAGPDLSESDLWAAGHYIAVCGAGSASMRHRDHLLELATRLLDASRAMRDQK